MCKFSHITDHQLYLVEQGYILLQSSRNIWCCISYCILSISYCYREQDKLIMKNCLKAGNNESALKEAVTEIASSLGSDINEVRMTH